MAGFNAAFKAEVQRLARKEIREATAALKKASAAHRRDIAALKRDVAELQRKVTFLEGQEKRRLADKPARAPADSKTARFSPGWVKADRKRLGISAKHYGRLVGVSGLTIYNWESGKSRPREKQIQAWAAVRGLGKREVLRRLDMLG